MAADQEFRVIVATDGSDNARDAVTTARHFPWPAVTRVRVVVARRSPTEYRRSILLTALDRGAEIAADHARRVLTPGWPDLDIVIVDKAPVTAVLDQAKRFGADVIVVGWRGHGAVRRALMGSVSRGIVRGAGVIFFAYIGFDAVSTATEETANPQRDVPIGLVSSLAICTVIYIVVSGLLTGVAHYSALNVSSPVAHALQLIGFNWASALVSTGVIAGLTTVMLVLYYALTRIIFAMSRDGLLSPFFAAVNAKTQTPVRVIVLCGVTMATIAGLVPLGELAELVNIGTLAAFVLVCLGVLVLRITKPELKRPFRNPFSPLFPIFGMLSCGALMGFLPGITWLRFIIWLIIGLIVYFVYSMHHSKLKSV